MSFTFLLKLIELAKFIEWFLVAFCHTINGEKFICWFIVSNNLIDNSTAIETFLPHVLNFYDNLLKLFEANGIVFCHLLNNLSILSSEERFAISREKLNKILSINTSTCLPRSMMNNQKHFFYLLLIIIHWIKSKKSFNIFYQWLINLYPIIFHKLPFLSFQQIHLYY